VETTVTNGRNHRVGVTSTLKTCISTVSQNKKLKKARHENKGKRTIRALPVTMDELDLE